MKYSGFKNTVIVISVVIFTSFYFTGCNKKEDTIKFPIGTFPDSVISLSDINSPYDDYNLDLQQLIGGSPLIFSSNKKSFGGQFDLEQAILTYYFDQKTGAFSIIAKITTDPFLDKLISKAKTPGNDFGPYRLFSTVDGFEYLILSSVNSSGNLDLYYLKNQPAFGINVPDISGPFPVKLLNTASDDAYMSFNLNQDSAYFTSNREGNFDIFVQKKPADKDLASWFNSDYLPSVKADSINSLYDDKCPYIFKNIMIFTSNRPGGMGGYDLYYSLFKQGKWWSAVNLGPRINTSSDEYRPIIGSDSEFSNKFIMFSSNRPGGKGGFDLYFAGFMFPK
jgi:hypothetical protein